MVGVKSVSVFNQDPDKNAQNETISLVSISKALVALLAPDEEGGAGD